jgi:transcription antitermination factor NusG
MSTIEDREAISTRAIRIATERALKGMIVTTEKPPAVTADSAAAWHVVYTNVNCEFRVVGGLKEKNFPVYLPSATVWRSHARRRQKVKRPLFSRYVLVGFDPAADHWLEPIKTTDGVEDLLRMDDRPIQIPRRAVDDLMARERFGEFDFTNPTLGLNPGDELKVIDGPFAGETVIYDRCSTKHKLEAFLRMLGGLVRAEFEIESVRVLEEQTA